MIDKLFFFAVSKEDVTRERQVHYKKKIIILILSYKVYIAKESSKAIKDEISVMSVNTIFKILNILLLKLKKGTILKGANFEKFNTLLFCNENNNFLIFSQHCQN